MSDRFASAARPTTAASSIRPSRRSLVTAGLGALAASSARAASPAAGTEQPAEVDLIRWLVNHTTQGFTLADYDKARTLGYEGWIEHQLDHQVIDDSTLEARLAGFVTLNMSAAEIHDTYVAYGNNFFAARELRGAAVVRSVYSKRQLFERVVEFFTDHFSIDQLNFWDRWLKTVDDREVVRKHAFGSFPNMLRASAHSAAMLYYLNNDTNLASAPNENYARELLELHTLGVDGGYTENDVKEVARALTGWTFHPKGHPRHGEFYFDAAVHDYGAKTVLGLHIPAGGGVEDGGMVLDYLSMLPQTAQFLSRKLTSWLLMYDPPQFVVDRVAQAYLSSGGEIKEMIRAVFDRDTVIAANAWNTRKLKRPFHFAIGMLRASRVNVLDPHTFGDELELLGHLPYGWPQPNGLPDTLEYWSASLLPRWILASLYFDGQIEGMTFGLPALFAQVGGFDRAHAGQQMNEIFAGGALDANDVAQVQAFFDAHASVNSTVVAEGLALTVSSPSYQEY